MRYYLAHGHRAWAKQGMGHGGWGMGHGAYLTTRSNRYILGVLLKIIWVHGHSSAVKKL